MKRVLGIGMVLCLPLGLYVTIAVVSGFKVAVGTMVFSVVLIAWLYCGIRWAIGD